MSIEFKTLVIQNRINRLMARGKDNYSIVKKLERQLRNLDN